MKLTILQEDLSKALATTSRFTSAKAQLPILGNVLLSAHKNVLSLKSTNLETSVSISLGADVKEEGVLTVPSKVASEIVANFPKGQVLLESSKEKLKLSTESYSTSVLGMNAADFPEIPTNVGNDFIKIDSSVLVDSLTSVLFSASVDESRPVLTGVLFIFRKGLLTLVSTDGFRLSKRSFKVDNDKEFDLIIPKNALAEISRLLQSSKGIALSFEVGDSQVIFGNESVTLSSRIIQGEFPNYEKIIPKRHDITVNTDKDELLRAVKVAGVFARDSANTLTIKAKDAGITISAKSSASGSQEATVDAKIEPEPKTTKDKKDFEIVFNYRFIEEFLNNIKGQTVLMKFTDDNSAGVFLDASDENYLHLIMPVKL